MKNKSFVLSLLFICAIGSMSGQSITERHPVFSVRTNLVHWLMLTPDAGIEIRPIENFGILVSGAWTHWNWNEGNKHYRDYKINPELRLYLGRNKNFYLGAEYHLGEFNFKFNETGRQGDFNGGGLSGGYVFSIGRNLSLDLNLGLGATALDYEKYEYVGDVNVKREKKTDTIVGVNQLGVTLVWNL